MNRIKEIDKFLKDWAKIYSQNPYYNIDSDVLYSSLMNYGLSDQEKNNYDISSLFTNWINHFQNNPSLNVYHTMQQSAFLQFRSYGPLGMKHIKLYLSFPRDKMEYCVNKIFDFLAANNIPNGSKVSNRLRSDSVVLRLTNFEDTKKVIDYINSDSTLSTSAKSTNPFIMRDGVVGVAYDDNISYNICISMMLGIYFSKCRKNNTFENVNVNDFKNFVNSFIQNVFNDSNNIKAFMNLPEVNDLSKRFKNLEECILNFEQVLNLISYQLEDTMNLDKFHQFYKNATNNDINIQKIDKYNLILSKILSFENNSIEKTKLLNEYIDYAYLKYNNEQEVILYLRSYIEKNNLNAITRDKNFRNKFSQCLSPNIVLNIVNYNINDYVHKIIINKNNSNLDSLYKVFLKACMETYDKYGYQQLKNAIFYGLNGNYNYFTNGNGNYRDLLRNVSPEEFLQLCQKLNAFSKKYGFEYNHLWDQCSNTIEKMYFEQQTERLHK